MQSPATPWCSIGVWGISLKVLLSRIADSIFWHKKVAFVRVGGETGGGIVQVDRREIAALWVYRFGQEKETRKMEGV